MQSYKQIQLSIETKEKLMEAGVAVVYFFGSRATDTSSFFSDIDIGIVLEDIRLLHTNRAKLHTTIYEVLALDILDYTDGPKLDISFLQKANPALGMKAIRDGVILFESDARLRADFEEDLLRKYNDFINLQREYEEATIRAFE